MGASVRFFHEVLNASTRTTKVLQSYECLVYTSITITTLSHGSSEANPRPRFPEDRGSVLWTTLEQCSLPTNSEKNKHKH